MQSLQPNSTLQGGKYKIISVLGQGGFGITYLAEQAMLDRKVCIKEFFFKEQCVRDESTSHVTLGTQAGQEMVQRFLNKFLKEARTISQLDHPNIIKIHDIFEENNTAYYVMDYVEGENLSDLVKRQGALSEVTAVKYIKEVADAIKYIHDKKINHLDVKPGNIMLRKSDGKTVLIDFGLSKQYDEVGGQTSSTPVGVSQGYAPIEQYRPGGVAEFTPQTDIYSLGATLYWLIIGKTPPAADEILDEGLPALPSYSSNEVRSAIASAMQARKKDRPDSVEKWLKALEGNMNVGTSNRPKSNVLSTSITPAAVSGYTDSNDDDEATVLAVDSQREEERMRKEANTNAKTKAEENRTKAGAERRKEEEWIKEKKETKRNSWSIALWIVICVVAIGIIAYAVNNGNKSNLNETNQRHTVPPKEKKNKETFVANGVSFNMILVEAGTNYSTKLSEYNRLAEGRKWKNSIKEDFYIGETEVTQNLWEAVTNISLKEITGKNNWSTYGVGEDYPMYDVSMSDCKAFISKLNSITGKKFRLPTQKEWRYAAQGGNKSKGFLYSGSNNINDVAWNEANSNRLAHPVARKQPNELGLYDMSGNVWEMCADEAGYGGCWHYSYGDLECLIAYDNSSPHGDKPCRTLGLRLVLSE